jgi:hypothetical protein
MIEENPELQLQNRWTPIKVFMPIGAFHTRVPRLLKEGGNRVTARTFEAAKGLQDIAEVSAQKRAVDGENLSHEDGERYVMTEVFKGLILTQTQRSVLRDFKHLEETGVGELSVLEVFMNVYWDRREKIYAMPRYLINQRKKLYAQLMTERRDQLQAALDAFLAKRSSALSESTSPAP